MRRRERWLRWGAAASLIHLALTVLLLLLGTATSPAGLLVLVPTVIILLAWGPYQAEVALNPALGSRGRWGWRVALWCVPSGMALYYGRHVRPLRNPD